MKLMKLKKRIEEAKKLGARTKYRGGLEEAKKYLNQCLF